MACTKPIHSPLHQWHNILRALPTLSPIAARRPLTTSSQTTTPKPRIPPSRLPPNMSQKVFTPPKKIKTYPPPPSTLKHHPFAISSLNSAHIQTLDPTGSRTRLFARSNPDVPRVGDILLTTFTTGDPFSGVCLNIRRRGPDTAILLRNRILTVGVEMWVKIYSPKVRSIEVVERAVKRARRARLYYMRKPKHDRGSVEGVVEEYLKRRRLVRSGAVGIRDPAASAKNPSSARKGVGAR
ncbi:MAG: hypothetical protein Q9169_006735 [Polycauliona sp. 2 TL-2023]